MRRHLTTTLTAAAAAGLTALAVTVAAPAADNQGKVKVDRNDGPTPEALVTCLGSHGATGLPDANQDEGRALKDWIVTHQTDESARGALEACDVYFEGKTPGEPDSAAPCPAPAPAEKAGTAARKRAFHTRASAKRR